MPGMSDLAPPAPPLESAAGWLVYIIEAADGTLYTGITTDIERRWQQHVDGRGARYLRGRAPRAVVHVETGYDQIGRASCRERVWTSRGAGSDEKTTKTLKSK